MDVRHALQASLGLETVRYRHELSPFQLFHEAIANDRGRVRVGGEDAERKAFATRLGVQGPLVFHSDPTCTGRPVQDTFAVAWPEVEGRIWWKDSLKPFDPDRFEPLLARVTSHLNATGATLYVQDGCVGVDPAYAIPYRFVGEYATHALFARNMFPRSVPGVVNPEAKRWTMLNVQSFRCEPERDGTRSDRAVIIDFRNRICLVVGRADYCGIVKKSIFTVMNFLLPDAGHLSMHCSSNIGSRNDSAIMFGLSGTGKTTLSADPNRRLIGDDETGWTDEGLSNLEDGCYAKLINLDKEAEPVIASALSMPGTIIENVPSLPRRRRSTTRTRRTSTSVTPPSPRTPASRTPCACNPNVAEGSRGGHPATIVLLTADAFGVLPPVSILGGEDVMYHFVQGFTAKLAGTEVGLEEPEATFSSCFGAPFMTHRPNVYAELLRSKMDRHRARCILLNTGWSGGAVGHADRMPIRVTRALLDAALAGRLHEDGAEYETHPVFNLRMPKRCPGVDPKALNPRTVWPDGGAYDAAAARLRDLFRKNFKDNGFAGFGIQAVM